jgi:hypothetical protein
VSEAPPTKPDAQPHGRGRRSGSRERRAPLILVAVIAVCAALLAVVPAARYMGWTRSEAPRPTVAPGKPADLVLSEAVFVRNGEAVRIAGRLQNISRKRYENVALTFRTRDEDGFFVANAAAEVPLVEPGGTAPFTTGPVPARAERLQLEEVSGDAR